MLGWYSKGFEDIFLLCTNFMNIAFFIASKISGIRKSEGFSGPIVWLASATVALALSVMMIAVSVVTGFQKEISEKVTSLQAHIQVQTFAGGSAFESEPFTHDPNLALHLSSLDGVKSVTPFSSKPGILKWNGEIQGVLFKGLATDYPDDFFQTYLVEGEPLKYKGDSTESSIDIAVSVELCRKLGLKLNDSIVSYFINRPGPKVPEVSNPQRAPRTYRISAIYETGLAELDEKMVFCDMRQVQDLNNWYFSQIGGYEIMIDDVSKLEELTDEVRINTPFDLLVRNVKDVEPEIFIWLEYQNVNVLILIILMIVVGTVSITSALLILILERTNMIGILKALGANQKILVRVFLYRAAIIVSSGMLIGNVISFALIYAQRLGKFIRLDKATYYVEVVPMHTPWLWFLAINVGTFIICMLALLGPVQAIKGVKPIKAIRFD